MKTNLSANNIAPATPATSQVFVHRQPKRGPHSGRLAQLAAIAARSPRVQAQLKLASEMQNSNRVQRALALGSNVNGMQAALQGKFEGAESAAAGPNQAGSAHNQTGLPDQLKTGVENLSGLSLNDVKVHYNSSQPAQLNALAYAQGSDIHIGPGQERHLPHEAWHIVQQKQGRVRPTAQMKSSVPVNDDPALEHEADVMGAQALHTTTEARDQDRSEQQPAQATQATVQRAVGYEFESGWLVANQQEALDWEKAPAETRGPKPAPKPLKKKDLVYPGEGFKIEADEAAEGNAELEFIVHPPVAENEAGKRDLLARMSHMTVVGAKLLRAGEAPFTLDAATGDETDSHLVITPNDRALNAKPQATAGITLPQVAKLGAKQKGKELNKQFDITIRQAESYRAAVEGALRNLDPVKVLEEPDATWSESLRGFLMLMASYISGGERAVLYPKQITDAFLLGRTDMVALFRLLPKEEQEAFKKNWKLLLLLAMSAADVYDTTAPVIGKVWTDETYTANEPIGPSREKWVFFIVNGYDLLSAAHYKEIETEAAAVGKELESLGEMGKKTEAVGASKTKGGIFELRGAALKGPLPLLQWFPFADEVLDYFINLSEVQGK